MNKAKQFILDNDPQIEEAVDQGYGIVMTEDELLEWMQRYADNEVKNLALPQVSSSLLAEIERLINKYKEERLPNRNKAFHYEAEIDSGFNHFMAWLISNDR